MKQLIVTLIVLFAQLVANAQDSLNATQKPTGLYSENKIYVVLVVAVTILIGLLLYVARLDRKITKLEKQSS